MHCGNIGGKADYPLMGNDVDPYAHTVMCRVMKIHTTEFSKLTENSEFHQCDGKLPAIVKYMGR